VTIRELALDGFEAVDTDDLPGLLGDVQVGAPFVLARLERVGREVKGYALERGHLAVVVPEPVVERVARDAVRVELVLRRGPRHVLRAAEVEGGAAELREQLDAVEAEAKGRVFVPHLPYELRARVLRVHGEAGYPDCAVEIETEQDEASGDVELVLRTEPGPKVRIATIEVRGTELAARRLRARLELERGDVYDAERLDRSFQSLYATGLFDSIRFGLEGQGEQRTLVVDVVEAPSLQFFVEPGYGSYEGPRVRLGVDENNLFGSGRRGSLEGWYSELARGVELQFADPFLFRAPITGQATFFAKDREEPSFTVDEVGTELALRREWSAVLSTNAAVKYSATDLSDVDLAASVPPQFVDSADIGELTFALAYDTRDNVLMPSSGRLARFHTGVATELLNSSIEAFENGVDLATLIPVDERTQIVARGSTAVIAPFGGTDDIPLQRRMFNGGENTVRSFREHRLGPVDPNNEPVGGEARSLVSLELRRGISGNLSGAVFYDAGNVELEYEDYFEMDGFRHAVGLGVRNLLPIGPLRLDAAWNPDHRSEEDEWVVHFAVGLP
jgi:outer membrane protein assembly complex protein YaeT